MGDIMRYGSVGSGEIGASAVVYAGACFITSLMVYTDGINDVTVKVYDNAAAAAGRVAGKVPVEGASDYGGRNWPANAPNRCGNGLYAEIVGVGGSCIVEFQKCG